MSFVGIRGRDLDVSVGKPNFQNASRADFEPLVYHHLFGRSVRRYANRILLTRVIMSGEEVILDALTDVYKSQTGEEAEQDGGDGDLHGWSRMILRMAA